MEQEQMYFAYAMRAGHTLYHQEFPATSRKEARGKMEQYVLSQLPEGSDLAEWKFLVRTKGEEETFRALKNNRPL